MKTQKRYEQINIKHQVAPLIDVVFLLLVYFMVTSTLIQKEGDLAFRLPAPERGVPVTLPVDAYIQLDANGMVSIAGMQFESSDRKLEGLVHQLRVLKEMAELQQSPFFVTVAPDDRTLHGRIVDVLDACAAAKVPNMTFARNDA